MYDSCYGFPSDAATENAYGTMALALRNAGRNISFLVSDPSLAPNSIVWGEAAGGNAVWTYPDVGTMNWGNITGILDNQYGLEGYTHPGRWNLPDFLGVGDGILTDTEGQSNFSLWSILAAPLWASTDLTTASPATIATLTNSDVIAVDQDVLGVQGKRVSRVSCGDAICEVYARQLSDGAWAVVLFNRSSAPQSISATWSMFGQTGPFTGRDLWVHSDLGTLATGYTATVASHGVVMLKLNVMVPPSVSLTAPSNGATVSGIVTVSASSTAVSPASISSVQFYLDSSTLLGTVTSSPYTTFWNTATTTNGTHTLYALATDNYSNAATSSAISVTVANAPVISSIASSTATSTATITWNTDEAANSQVQYGLTLPYSSSSALNSATSTSHSVLLTGLTGLTTYHFMVESSLNGLLSTSSDRTFMTASASLPTASNVTVTGTTTVGSTLTGSYTFSDPNNKIESGSTYQWLRSSSSGGSYSAIANATTTTHVLTSSDIGQYLEFQVTPASQSGTGTATTSPATAQIQSSGEPTATGVNISGTARVGQTLTGSYTYHQADGVAQGVSTFRWLESSTSGGTYTAIPSATGINYVLTDADTSQYLKFEITPIASVSPTTGLPVLSPASSQILNMVPASAGGGGITPYLPPSSTVIPAPATPAPAPSPTPAVPASPQTPPAPSSPSVPSMPSGNNSQSSLPYVSNTLVLDHGAIYLIMGQAKIGFTSMKAFTGLGYSMKNVVKGDTSGYSQSGVLSSPSQVHPEGSWIISGKAVFYVSASSYIPIPSWDIFLADGGQARFIVKANWADIKDKRPTAPSMVANDSRVGN